MDTERILAESGARKNQLLVKLTGVGGTPLLDVRFWYRDAEGELKPTRKGISLTAGHFGAVAEAFEGHSEDIQAWLAGEGSQRDDETVAGARARAAAAAALGRAGHLAPHAVAVETIEDPRQRAGFAVEHWGGTDKVIFNRAHPFVERMEAATTADEVRALLADLLAVYGRARRAVAEEGDDGLLSLLEHEWGERLAAIARTPAPRPQ